MSDIAQQIAALEALIDRRLFTAAELDEAEKTLRRAYRTTVQGSESASSFFAGMYRTENKQFKESRMPEYLHDPEYPGERRDRWATQVHFKESARAKFSRPPIDQQGYLYPAVHATVNHLPERDLVFIKSQYMPAGNERGAFLARYLESFWRDYQPHITGGVNRAVLYIFAQVVIAQGNSDEKWTVKMLREKINVKKANWHKTYLPHWRALRSQFLDARRSALTAFLNAQLTPVDKKSTFSTQID